MIKFWTIASGSYKIDPEALHSFLIERGYYTFKPNNVKTVILVKVDGKKVKQVHPKDIREHCWRFIEAEYQFSSDEERRQIKSEFFKSYSYFSSNNLVLIPRIEINEIKDAPDKSYLFFNNYILEITAYGIVKKSYDQIEGHVFETDINDIDFKFEIPEKYELSGEFYEFLKDICKNPNKQAENQNLDSMITIIGYLSHRYKDPTNAKAIILMDTYKDQNANGGTGKGVFRQGLERIRKTVHQDGKFSSFSDRFLLSNVEYGTRILVFDDVPKNFDFEKIFPLITEKAVVERKYENKFTIPFEESPKVLITTNYTIEGAGLSHKRRKVEFIFSDTYNDKYDPEIKFGHLMYSGWDKNEWEKFFLFIAYCLQMYLLEGLIQPKFNIGERKLKMEASSEFIQYVNSNIEPGAKYNKKVVYDYFYTKFPSHFKIEMTTFRNWLKLFADAYGFGFYESHSGNDNFFEITTE